MTLDEYFQLQSAERFLLLEITRNDPDGKTYFLSDGPYATEPFDVPGSLIYAPVISAPGLPELKRSIADPFTGSGSTSFGTVTLGLKDAPFWFDSGVLQVDIASRRLLDVDGLGTLLSLGHGAGIEDMVLRRGATVVGKLAGPRRFFKYSDAKVLFRGQISRQGGDSDGSISVEITDLAENISKSNVIISNLPLCYGRCRNIELFVVDPGNLIYAAHDGVISAVSAVYDDGVLLNPPEHITPGYSYVLGTAQITLVNTPAGRVTADVDGAVDVDGVWLSSTAQIAAALLARSSLEMAQDYGRVTDSTIGVFIKETTNLGDLLTRIFRGAAAFYYVDPDGTFRAGRYEVPSAPGTVYNEQQQLEKFSFINDDRLHSSIRFSYRRNWTQYQSKPGATTAQAQFSQVAALDGSVSLAAPDTELIYLESALVETFFDTLADAEEAANRLLRIFGVPRYKLTGALAYSEIRSLGDSLSLIIAGHTYRAIIWAMGDVFDGEFPQQRLELLA